METIRATYKVVTPLFSSRADQEEFGLSAASFKGVLRFWWRALVYGRYSGDLTVIRKRENELFGSTDTGLGSFLLKIDIPQKKILAKDQILCLPGSKDAVGPGTRYLGYGIMEAFGNRNRNTQAGQLTRPCLMPPATLEVVLASGCPIDQEVLDALKLLGLLGGLGSRSRRGWGSLALETLYQNDKLLWSNPKDQSVYPVQLKELLVKPYVAGLPSITAISSCSRIEIVTEGDSPLALHNKIGEKMQLYRSWGKNNLVNYQPAQQNFPSDHIVAHNAALGGTVTTHPERIIFGLPHNYFFSSDYSKVEVSGDDFDRRASPLFIHIHSFPSGGSIGVIVLLPSIFLPTGSNIKIGKNSIVLSANYNVLENFFDGIPVGGTRNPYFSNKTVIFP